MDGRMKTNAETPTSHSHPRGVSPPRLHRARTWLIRRYERTKAENRMCSKEYQKSSEAKRTTGAKAVMKNTPLTKSKRRQSRARRRDQNSEAARITAAATHLTARAAYVSAVASFIVAVARLLNSIKWCIFVIVAAFAVPHFFRAVPGKPSPATLSADEPNAPPRTLDGLSLQGNTPSWSYTPTGKWNLTLRRAP